MKWLTTSLCLLLITSAVSSQAVARGLDASTDSTTRWTLPPVLPPAPTGATDITDMELEAIAAQLDLTLDEAHRRVQHQPLVSQLSQYLEENSTLEGLYSGLWVDERDGAVVIALTDTVDEFIEELRGVAPPELEIRGIMVPYSLKELRAVQEQIVDHRDRDFSGYDKHFRMWDGGYDVDIDIRRSRVVVTFPDDGTPRTLRLEEELHALALPDGLAEITFGETSRPACTRADCRYGMRGGLDIRNVHGASCSSSYSVRANGTNVYGLMTAGHCSGLNMRHGGENMGYVHGRIVQGAIDALWIKLNSGWSTHRWIYRDDNAKAYQIRSTDSYAQTFVSQFVCKSGIETLLTCGHVTSKNGSPGHVPNAHSFIISTACVGFGDSGGPLYVHGTSRATGHVSGRLGSCPSGSSNSGHIQYAQSALIVTVKTW